MKINAYHKGNLRSESLNGDGTGWVLGCFAKNPSLNNSDIEVKYFEYKKGEDTKHQAKVSKVIEWTYVLSGSISGHIDGQKVVLKAGEYVLIHPDTVNNLAENVLENMAGITIKSPSRPGTKKVVTTD